MEDGKPESAPKLDVSTREQPMEAAGGDIESNLDESSTWASSKRIFKRRSLTFLTQHSKRFEDNGSTQDASSTVRNLYIKRLSSHVLDTANVAVVQQLRRIESRISAAVRQAGEDTLEVCALEVWIFDEETSRLTRPDGGWWRSPNLSSSDAIKRLEDPTHPKFVAAQPTMAGVNIVGELWSESKSAPSFNFRDVLAEFGGMQGDKHVIWRDIRSLLVNPDMPRTERVEVLEEAGFRQAAGVPFEAEGVKGIVIYFTQLESQTKKLKSIPNEACMIRSAAMIGSVIAASDARRAAIALEMQEIHDRDEKSLDESRGEKAQQMNGMGEVAPANSTSLTKKCCFWVKAWLKKSLGGKLQPPPAMGWSESVFTLFGCMGGLAIFQLMVNFSPLINDGGFHLMGPIGSLMALQYGLTASPAAQPRNIFLGQAVVGVVAIGFTYIPMNAFSFWIRTIIGPAMAITAMTKLGVTHPPAGATAVMLAAKGPNWDLYACILLVSFLAILPAVLINNISRRRQYPTYWGVLPPSLKERLAVVRDR